MIPRVVKVVPLPQFRLRIEFQDGVSGEIDIFPRLSGPVFEPLRDEALFRQVSVDAYGAVYWPNGPDLAPDAIYSRLTGTPIFAPDQETASVEEGRPA
jgi:hypothetical protein